MICIFSQYGEILHINLVRDKQTGKSKGFAFLRYADQRSTILAVDNLNGSEVLGRKLRVDHVSQYKQPKKDGDDAEDYEQDPRATMNVAPIGMIPEKASTVEIEEDYTKGIDPEDPMFEYLVEERKAAAREGKMSSSRTGDARHRDRSRERHRRHRSRRDSQSPDRSRHRHRERLSDRHHRKDSRRSDKESLRHEKDDNREHRHSRNST